MPRIRITWTEISQLAVLCKQILTLAGSYDDVQPVRATHCHSHFEDRSSLEVNAFGSAQAQIEMSCCSCSVRVREEARMMDQS